MVKICGRVNEWVGWRVLRVEAEDICMENVITTNLVLLEAVDQIGLGRDEAH